MSDQPKPTTGEWTEGKVFSYFESEDFKGLAKDINAALAAERENSEKAAARAELAQINLNIANEAMIKAIRIADDYEKQLAAEREKAGTWTLQDGKPELLDGDIEKLKTPDYHQLNKHAGRNDRLLHAVLCAYIKHHYYEDNHIGWDELDRILLDAICNEIGDDAFCEWSDNLK